MHSKYRPQNCAGLVEPPRPPFTQATPLCVPNLGPPRTPQTSQSYDTKVLKGDPQLFPHYAEKRQYLGQKKLFFCSPMCRRFPNAVQMLFLGTGLVLITPPLQNHSRGCPG